MELVRKCCELVSVLKDKRALINVLVRSRTWKRKDDPPYISAVD